MSLFGHTTERNPASLVPEINSVCSQRWPRMGWGSKRGHRQSSTRGGDSPPSERKSPDPGLSSTHELIQYLGSGGSGETWQYRDLQTGEFVAVKLIPRPIPRAIVPEHVFREIKARLLP